MKAAAAARPMNRRTVVQVVRRNPDGSARVRRARNGHFNLFLLCHQNGLRPLVHYGFYNSLSAVAKTRSRASLASRPCSVSVARCAPASGAKSINRKIIAPLGVPELAIPRLRPDPGKVIIYSAAYERFCSLSRERSSPVCNPSCRIRRRRPRR